MSKKHQDLFRAQRKFQKRLDRSAAHLREQCRPALIEIVQSAVTTKNMKTRAEGLLKTLDKRANNIVERHKKLDDALARYDKKPQVIADSTPDSPPAKVSLPEPKPSPVPEIDPDPEVRRARVAELEIELKKVAHEEEQIRRGATQNWTEREQRLQREIHAAIRAEYASLVPKPESRLTPEEAERIKQQQVREAATDRWLREQDEEIKRQATRPGLDIKMRLQAYEEEIGGGACLRNGDLYVSAPNTWSVYEELHNRR